VKPSILILSKQGLYIKHLTYGQGIGIMRM